MVRMRRHAVMNTSWVTSSAASRLRTTEYACQYTGRTWRPYSSANDAPTPTCALATSASSSGPSCDTAFSCRPTPIHVVTWLTVSCGKTNVFELYKWVVLVKLLDMFYLDVKSAF